MKTRGKERGAAMKLSAKGRYGLAAMTHLAMNYQADVPITIISISERLGISKIYLEQVFSLLKRAKLVQSVKGAQGGYHLMRAPKDIPVYSILTAIELPLVETAAPPTAGKAPALDRAIMATVYEPLDACVKDAMSAITLADLLHEVEKESRGDTMMFYI